MPENTLLIVDDEAAIRDFVEDIADSVGYRTMTVNGFDSFKETLSQNDPTLILLDLMMPDADGIELLRFLADNRCSSKIVLMSGLDTKVLSSARRLGVERGLNMVGVLHKPFQIDDLEALLQKNMHKQISISPDELISAIHSNHLIVHYQPKIKFMPDGTRPIVGAEALVRWRHPLHGMVPPSSFIPLAEQNGQIDALTDLVFQHVLDQLQVWKKHRLDIGVSINVAPQTLTDLNYPDKLGEMISEAGVSTNSIILEITETGAMGDNLITSDILTRFRVKGLRLSLDDFGTGYSSLIELYRMPFTELKIDRSFVFDLERSEEARVIVKSIIDLAHNLSLSVCAEGAESEKTLEYLQREGCDTVQGFVISRPLPSDEFIEFVTQWNFKMKV